MYRLLAKKRGRRAGITTVEYAVLLFLIGVTAIFGIPNLVKTTHDIAGRTGTSIDHVASTDSSTD